MTFFKNVTLGNQRLHKFDKILLIYTLFALYQWMKKAETIYGIEKIVKPIN